MCSGDGPSREQVAGEPSAEAGNVTSMEVLANVVTVSDSVTAGRSTGFSQTDLTPEANKAECWNGKRREWRRRSNACAPSARLVRIPGESPARWARA